jgi:glucan 1,3-beta-glucosidase
MPLEREHVIIGTFDDNPLGLVTHGRIIRRGMHRPSLGEATMDALGNTFFWTWKIGASNTTRRVMSPMWSYQLAIEGGWALADPRTSVGACTALGSTGMTFTGPLPLNQVGGSTTMSVPILDTFVWSPDSIGGFESAAEGALLPKYTPTGPIPTLPVPNFTASGSMPTSTANLGNGRKNATDTTLMAVPIGGCTYPDPLHALTAAISGLWDYLLLRVCTFPCFYLEDWLAWLEG